MQMQYFFPQTFNLVHSVTWNFDYFLDVFLLLDESTSLSLDFRFNIREISHLEHP